MQQIANNKNSNQISNPNKLWSKSNGNVILLLFSQNKKQITERLNQIDFDASGLRQYEGEECSTGA